MRSARYLLAGLVLLAGCTTGSPGQPPVSPAAPRPVPCLSTVPDGPFADCVELTLTLTWNMLFGATRRAYRPPALATPNTTAPDASAPDPTEQSDPVAAHRAYYDPRTGVHVPTGYLDDLRAAYGEAAHLALAFSLAHETGHHVQELLHPGQPTPPEPDRDAASQQVEMQADCYAGVWAHAEQAAGELDRAVFLAAGTAELRRLSTATTGGVNPEREVRTHGTPEQRAAALTRGLDSGDPAACDLGELTWAPQ